MTLEHTRMRNGSSFGDGAYNEGQRSSALSTRNSAVLRAHESNGDFAGRLTPALGWLSLGLGVSALLYPSKMAEKLGLQPNDTTQSALRGVGLREIVSGIGILSSQKTNVWLWSRVLGDAMDLTLLRKAMTSGHSRDGGAVSKVQAAVAGITAMDLYASTRTTAQPHDGWADGNGLSEWQSSPRRRSSSEPVVASVTIRRSPEEVYAFWRDFSNLPRFMAHLESVQVMGDRRSHWRALGPGNKAVEWDAEIVDERPNEMIAWRSLENADVSNSGSVRFQQAPGGRGTEVLVELSYKPPAGVIGRTIAELLGREPDQEVHSDLRRLKSVMEVGEVLRSDANLGGPSITLKQSAAQPPNDAPPFNPAVSQVSKTTPQENME